MKIMIGGGFDETEPDSPQSTNIRLLARKLGDQVIRQNHGLRSGNMTSLDAVVIEAACGAVPDDKNCEDLVVSYTPRGAEKFTRMGAVRNSGIDDWSVLSGRRLRVPEPLEDSDVLILLGGFDSTYTAANWARASAKPILPVASFGLAAEDIFADELAVLKERTDRRVTVDEFQKLNRAIVKLTETEAEKYAAEIVALAERAALSREVFVIMSFEEDHKLEDYLDNVKRVCSEYGFNAVRMDQRPQGDSDQIIDSIHRDIASCGFVIADLTNQRPNVYYEIGYARGLGKPVVLTSEKDTPIHFDIQGYSRIDWAGGKHLREQLKPRIAKLAQDFGAQPV